MLVRVVNEFEPVVSHICDSSPLSVLLENWPEFN